MSDRIRPHRSASKEVARVAQHRLDKARKALNLPARQRARGIHHARKRIKELRALLRLVRLPLGKRYKTENRRLRDAARLLSELRDREAQLEAWDALVASSPVALTEALQHGVRRRLAARPGAAGGSQSGNQAIGEALAMLDQVESDIDSWPIDGKGFGVFEASLRKTLRDGRKALARAQADPSAETLHEWRKRVKDQWYQTRYLGRAWPAVFDARAAQLKQLAQMLGDDHDLWMLEDLLAREPALFGNPEERLQVSQLMTQRRGYLQREALALGRKLYTESPGSLCRRWRGYWRLAREEGRVRQGEERPERAGRSDDQSSENE